MSYINGWNDEQLILLEKEINNTFTMAVKETQKKADDFIADFIDKDKAQKELLSLGQITEQDYKSWRSSQLLRSERYNKLIEEYTEMINKYDVEALAKINNTAPNIFLQNGNYAAYSMELKSKIDYGFTLWNQQTVSQLLLQTDYVLPKILNVAKNNAWNEKAIRRQITQGILQGESIPKIAKRLQNVTDMNKKNAITNARTAVTNAQSAGVQARMDEARSLGLTPKKRWDARIDSRTRDSHIALDGQTVNEEESFNIGGYSISRPGDPMAPPALVYNCRCSLQIVLEGQPTGYFQTQKFNDSKYKSVKKSLGVK